MFPKKGNYFPKGAQGRRNGVSYPAAIAAALKSELGTTHQASKTLIRWTGANERTVKNWLSGRRGPRGEHLLSLMRHSTAVFETVLRLSGREQSIQAAMVVGFRDTLVKLLTLIDASAVHQNDG